MLLLLRHRAAAAAAAHRCHRSRTHTSRLLHQPIQKFQAAAVGGFTDANKAWLKPARGPAKAPTPDDDENDDEDGGGMDGPPASDDSELVSSSSGGEEDASDASASDLSGSDSDGECMEWRGGVHGKNSAR